jgi:hypothetical protein
MEGKWRESGEKEEKRWRESAMLRRGDNGGGA